MKGKSADSTGSGLNPVTSAMLSVEKVKEALTATLGKELAGFIGSPAPQSDKVRKAIVDILASLPVSVLEPLVEVIRDSEDEEKIREVMEEPDDIIRLKVTISLPGSIRFLPGSIL